MKKYNLKVTKGRLDDFRVAIKDIVKNKKIESFETKLKQRSRLDTDL